MRLMFVSVLIISKIIEVVTQDCPSTKEAWLQKSQEVKCGTGQYHCLQDEVGRIKAVCLAKTWIQPGFCPEFNNVAGKIDVSLCKESRGKCPTGMYWSNEIYKFSACVPKIITTTTQKIFKSSSVTIVTKLNTTSQSAPDVTKESEKHTDNERGNAIIIAVLLICIVVIALIIGVVVFIMYRRRKSSMKEDKAKFTPEKEKLNQEENKTDTVECISEMEKLKQKEEKPDTEPVAVKLSETKKVSVDGEFTYSNKFHSEEEIKANVVPILNNCGIVVLISDNKPAMTNVALSVAKDYPKYEKAVGFYDWYRNKSDPSKTTCVIFDNCFKNEQGEHINLSSLKFQDLCDAIYEVRRNSKGNLKFIVTVPQMLWNARKKQLESLKLFHDIHILKFKLDKPQ